MDLTEPRDSNKRHKLIDIITIALCAVICGADTWEDIEEFGTKEEWFEQFLKLPHGIPGHDTFARVFAGMDPTEFQQAFLKWVEAVKIVTNERIVAIDGKTLRRSHEKNKSPLRLVSAWALENKMVLGQIKTRENRMRSPRFRSCLRSWSSKGASRPLMPWAARKKLSKLSSTRVRTTCLA